jgi:hypothetical protein
MIGRGRPEKGAEVRLDPVRWRRPGRSTLIRVAAVAALLGTAAVVSWSRPAGCTPASPPTSAAHTSPPVSGATLPATGRPGPTAERPTVPPGTVGVPVRPAEPTTLGLVRPGDRVDLLSVDPAGGRTTTVADDALVIGVTGADDPLTGGLLLALDPAEAKRTIGTADRARFAVVIRART